MNPVGDFDFGFLNWVQNEVWIYKLSLEQCSLDDKYANTVLFRTVATRPRHSITLCLGFFASVLTSFLSFLKRITFSWKDIFLEDSCISLCMNPRCKVWATVSFLYTLTSTQKFSSMCPSSCSFCNAALVWFPPITSISAVWGCCRASVFSTSVFSTPIYVV